MTSSISSGKLILEEHQRVSQPACSTETLVFALLYLRWGAGVLENLGFSEISELAAALMMAVLGFLLLFQMRIAWPSSLLFVGLLGWAFTGLLSLFANTVPSPTKAASLIFLITFYGFFANACFTYLCKSENLNLFSRFLTVFICIGAVLGFYQVLTGSGFAEVGKIDLHRALGSDVHPVSFAIQLVTAAVAVECVRRKRQQKWTMAHITILALAVTGLYLTFARTAWLMTAMILAYYLLARGNSTTRLGLCFIVLPVVTLFFLTSERFSDLGSISFFWQNFSFQNLVFDHRYIDNSLSWRIVNWGLGFQQALEQPFLGFGPGQSASASYFSLEMHNIFLETFFEGGLLGLSAFLVCLAGLFKIHRNFPLRTLADRQVASLANGLGMALLFATALSTSFVDQLMSFIMYMLLLTIASIPTQDRIHGP